MVGRCCCVEKWLIDAELRKAEQALPKRMR